jgi:large subunit ribosomal protein L5
MKMAEEIINKTKLKLNPNKQIKLEKITINICVGNDKAGMVKAEKLIKKVTNDRKPATCCAKRRLATWQIRPGLPIGYRTTIRGDTAKQFLKWIFESKQNKFNAKSIDKFGNFAIGVHEYLDLKGMKYDADIGIMGFELMVTFNRNGQRVKRRLKQQARIPKRHKVTKEEVVNYLKENFGVEVKE